ncbi:MAG: hypothetical protein ABIR26_14745, partial [Ramlibacter sp.]
MNVLASLARFLFIALWCTTVAAQQTEPPTGSRTKVSGSMQLGHVAFALPPGEWQVVPLEELAVLKTDYSCRCEQTWAGIHRWPVQQAFAIQLDPVKNQLKSAIYFRASQATVPMVKVWFTNACDARGVVLHRDSIDGSFNYPACLTVEALESPSTGHQAELEARLWDWMKANGVEVPHVLLAVKYLKYATGDHVWALHYVNPDQHGIKPAAQRSPGEWAPDVVKADPQKSEYLARLRSWSFKMADESRSSLRAGKPSATNLPAIPSM